MMKSTLRNAAFMVSAASLTGLSYGQSFEFRAGAGAAAQNGVLSVGDIGSAFDLEVWYTGAMSGQEMLAGQVFLGFGMASSYGSSTNLDDRLRLDTAVDQGVSYFGFQETVRFSNIVQRGAGDAMSGSNNPFGGSMRPYGVLTAFSRGASGDHFVLGANPVHLYTFHMVNHNLAPGFTSLNVLVYNRGASGIPNAGTSGWSFGAGGGTNDGSAYLRDSSGNGGGNIRVTATPEPTSMAALAIGAGGWMLKRRRRHQK